MEYQYQWNNGKLHRTISFSSGNSYSSSIAAELDPKLEGQSGESAFYQNWLKSNIAPDAATDRGDVRVVDLFSGCGGLTLGIAEACRALNYNFVSVLAADMAPSALELYQKNFNPIHVIKDPIEEHIDAELGAPVSEREEQFLSLTGSVDVLIGGPPCQGNSDLNNHTRRNDPRNLLYLRMIRCVEIMRPRFVIIENVPGVQHDTHNVVDIAKDELQKLGYYVDTGVINMAEIGVPQNRKRFFLIASKEKPISISRAIETHRTAERTVHWAIGDLLNTQNDSVYDTPANSSATNKKRIDYLFDNDIFDLPNSERPDCHRLKKHSYTSVYGRMYWDAPSPTITGGFGSNGQGRFVHPKCRRTITPHEAARIQFFPDFFKFDGVKRRELQQIIGNAVPSIASYILGIEFLGETEKKWETNYQLQLSLLE